MEGWWGALSNNEKLFWAIAVVSTLLFTFQMALVFFAGTDIDGDTDAGGDMHGDMHDGDGHFDSVMGYFTIRNLIAFFMGFGWGGLAMLERGYSTFPSVLGGAIIGALFVFVVMMVMKGLALLKNEGTLAIQNAVGAAGTVSISIPKEMSGSGKISVIIQGRLVEVEAVTRGEKRLARGAQIKVIEVAGAKLVVEKE